MASATSKAAATDGGSKGLMLTQPLIRDAVAENANLLEVILTRLAAKGSACAAKGAEDAELFLIPILPKSKHWSEWVAACDTLKRSTFSPSFWRKALPHLDDETARRHFFVFPRVAYVPKCAGWWATPLDVATFKDVARVSVGGYEEFEGDFQRGKTLKGLSARQRSRPICNSR